MAGVSLLSARDKQSETVVCTDERAVDVGRYQANEDPCLTDGRNVRRL